jgi:hydrogenase maturation factor HypF (carbamoyltransferase family)
MSHLRASAPHAESGPLKPAPDVAGVNECCKDVLNLERIETRMPFTTDRCTVCGNRHRRVHVDLSALLPRGA